jgi:hypothetical protein
VREEEESGGGGGGEIGFVVGLAVTPPGDACVALVEFGGCGAGGRGAGQRKRTKRKKISKGLRIYSWVL